VEINVFHFSDYKCKPKLSLYNVMGIVRH